MEISCLEGMIKNIDFEVPPVLEQQLVETTVSIFFENIDIIAPKNIILESTVDIQTNLMTNDVPVSINI